MSDHNVEIGGDIMKLPVYTVEWNPVIDEKTLCKSKQTAEVESPQEGNIIYIKNGIWSKPATIHVVKGELAVVTF